MKRSHRERYELAFLTLARAVTVGMAYVSAVPIPGLTSSFVAIFTSLLPFDIMVASTRPPLRLEDWRHFFVVLRPRVVSTAITLMKGVAVGTVFGIAALFGLPFIVGAVLTSGLAYVWASKTRHNISTYVALIGGLSLFERLAALEVMATWAVIRAIVETVALSAGGTLLGLGFGWVIGFVAGSTTRLFLSRPYRSLQSAAYDPPLERRPFAELVRLSDRTMLAAVTVEKGAPVANASLAELDLPSRWHTTVLSVKRDDEEIVIPRGSFVLRPGDELVLLTDRDFAEAVKRQFKASASAPGGSTSA